MLLCGLLGKKLGHSYSPGIHALMGDYGYRLFEREENGIGELLSQNDWAGLNVTIPYKKTVLPYMDEVSDTVRLTGSVNTITRTAAGKLRGDNTDVYGFMEMLRHAGIGVHGKKTLVLGSGGAACAVNAALDILGAPHVTVSRSGEYNYQNLHRHADARVIVNATPVGMYPDNGASLVDLKMFPALEGVVDLVYNPARTALLMQAESLGIPRAGGLYMLIAQAARSSELFTGRAVGREKVEYIYRRLSKEMMNLVLIGMPGCGKSTAAKSIARLTGRRLVDADEAFAERFGLTPAEAIIQKGEAAFRDMEQALLKDIGKGSGLVIAAGGGAVTREENYFSLHQNGIMIWLKRDVESLPAEGRPLSERYGAKALYELRRPLYERFADAAVNVSEDADETARRAAEAMEKAVQALI